MHNLDLEVCLTKWIGKKKTIDGSAPETKEFVSEKFN
jgi:hypothetical protein